ncbi:MAG: PAS domain S-box protein [Bacillota bacterium]|nr:PAS domain S-box protein [Bacillota bacterium]
MAVKKDQNFHDSDNILQVAVDAVQDGISILSTDLTILKVNKVMNDWYSHAAPLVGKKCYEAYHMTDSPCKICPTLKALKTGKPAVEEVALVQNGKQTGWLELFSYPIRDKSAEISGIVEIVHNITDRKENEEKYKALFQNSTDGIFLLSDIFIDCNDEVCRMWGYSRDEIIGRSPGDFSPPFQPDGRKSADAAQCYIRAALKGEKQSFYWQHQRKDGSLLDTEIKLASLTIRKEIILLAVMRDITERKKAEKVLEQSREWYRALAEDIPALITRISPDGKITYVNDASCEVIGSSRDEIVGSDFFQFVPDEYRDQVWKGLQSLTPENSVITYDHCIKSRWYSWKNRAVFDSEGQLKEYFTVGEDITRRIEYERKLEESEARNRGLVDAIPDMLVRYSRNGVILDAEIKGARQLTHRGQKYYEAGQLIGSVVTELLDPEVASAVMGGIKRALETGKLQLVEYSYPIDDKKSFLEARMIATGPDEVTSIIRNVTDRRETEEELQYLYQFESMVADISSAFVNNTSEKINETINFALEMSGKFFKADRSYIFRFSDDGLFMDVNHEWYAAGIASTLERNQCFPVEKTPWWVNKMLESEYVYIPDVEALPPEAELDKQDFQIEEIKSLLTLPMIREGKVIGFFGIDAVKEKQNWSEQQISLIKVVAEIIGGAIIKNETEEALKESEDRYREILATIEEGYYEADLSGNITYCNDAACRLFGGYSLDEIIGTSYKKLYKDPEAAFRTFHNVFLSGQPERGLILEMLRKDGSVRYGEISISLNKDKEGYVTGFKGIGKDVTERIEREQRLEYLSLHDQLTGIHNRAYFEAELKRLDNSREYPITIISADLDGLKLVNDTMGHNAGDRLLIGCAEVLKDSLRESDILVRVGGDEFSSILLHTDKATGEKVVRRIRENANQYNLTHQDLPIGISLGVATTESNEISLKDLFKRADDMMYRDKLYSSTSSRSKIVQSLLAALAERDYIAEGHARRLEELCRAVGEKLNLSSHQLADLALLAQVHDLGKVGIPDTILFKPGPLNEEEWEVMRGHPEKGFRIASSSPDLASVAELILKHHERWDGQGYPLGLKGEEIPVECRILSIVDAYDAMTNKRPYNEEKTKAEAVEEVKRNSGTQFDPTLVPIFLEFISRSAE